MSQEEAIEFLGYIKEHCTMWQRLIQGDIDRANGDD
jgi:hypothetical protein